MKHIGLLGKMIFQISDDVYKTLDKLKRSGTARFAKHDRHLQGTKLEFTGFKPEEIEFEIMLSEYCGVDPVQQFDIIKNYVRTGESVAFILGNMKYGEYRWVIEKYSSKYDYLDGIGNVKSMTMTISLSEYLK